MLPDLPTRSDLPAELHVGVPRECSFTGFPDAAFETLAALRAEPFVTTYRRLQPEIDAHVVGPFKRYRDDLVVATVLPERLPLETERNVFSRLLKNDYGAGGAHSHLWMSFYRTGRKRLTDPQMSHSIDPDGVSVGLYVGDHYGDYFRRFKDRVAAEPSAFADLLRGVLAPSPDVPPFAAYAYTKAKGVETRHALDPGTASGDVLAKATGVWVRAAWPRADVVALGPAFLDRAVAAVAHLWPLYVWQCAAADRSL